MSQNSTHHGSVTAQPILMKLETYNCCWKTTTTPNGILIRRRGWSGRIPSLLLQRFFLCLFGHFVKRTRCTSGPILMIYMSYNVFPRKGLLYGFCWYISPFRGSTPQNHNIGGVSRHFQAKPAKYSNFHIIKTTAWISTKFCIPVETVETTKYALWVVHKFGEQIQDDGQPPSWKIEKSWNLSNCLADCDEIWQG